MNRRTGRQLGAMLIVVALLGGIALVLTSGDDGGESATPDTIATTTSTTAPPIDAPIDLGGGAVLEPVAEVPGATTISIVEGTVRATDASTGSRHLVDVDGGEVEGPETFRSQSRLSRSEPSPDGDERWVAEATQLHRIDAEGEILDTVVLEVPGAITAIDDRAVWLTVSGIPAAHTGSGPGAQSVLQRVDREALEVVARPLDDPATFRFALGPDAVWVTVGRTLFRLDPTTLEPAAEVELAEPASALLATPDELLVVMGGAEPQLLRLDPVELGEVGAVPLGPGSVGDAALVGDLGRPGEVWILRPDDDAVARVVPTTGEVEEVEVPAPRRVETDEQGGVWLLSGAGGGTLLRAQPTG